MGHYFLDNWICWFSICAFLIFLAQVTNQAIADQKIAMVKVSALQLETNSLGAQCPGVVSLTKPVNIILCQRHNFIVLKGFFVCTFSLQYLKKNKEYILDSIRAPKTNLRFYLFARLTLDLHFFIVRMSDLTYLNTGHCLS